MKNFGIKVISTAALATLLAVPAFADDTHVMGAKLEGAKLLAGQLEQVASRFEGEAAPASLTDRLTVIEVSLNDAKALAGGDLDAEIGNVLDRVAMLKAEPVMSAGARGIAQEIEIKTQALRVNAVLMQALSHLDQATRVDVNAAAGLLESAKADLMDAEVKGGYHVQNDIDEIDTVLSSINDGSVEKAAISERIDEVSDHLYRFGATG